MESIRQSLGDLFSYESLVHAISGATGSVVGLTAFFPLDTIRTRLQAHDGKHEKSTLTLALDIIQREGVSGLYKGWFPVVSSLCCSNFVYFYTYNSLKIVFKRERVAAEVIIDLGLAFAAGVLNVLVTTPLWVANTRLKLQGTDADPLRSKDKVDYTGMVDCLSRILKEEGLAAMWAGTGPSIILAGNPAVQFMVYEFLKRNLQNYYGVQDLEGIVYFILGAVAKFVATVVTYPLQLLQTRRRAGNRKGKGGHLNTIQEIIRHRGWRGLYRGLYTKLAQTVLMAALMFLTYEKISSFVFDLFKTGRHQRR